MSTLSSRLTDWFYSYVDSLFTSSSSNGMKCVNWLDTPFKLWVLRREAMVDLGLTFSRPRGLIRPKLRTMCMRLFASPMRGLCLWLNIADTQQVSARLMPIRDLVRVLCMGRSTSFSLGLILGLFEGRIPTPAFPVDFADGFFGSGFGC